MVTADEEIQAKEFLKRAEIRTMKKDLMALREVDALKERDKIVKLRTLEEQLEEQRKKQEVAASAKAMADKERAEREEVLLKGSEEEKLAEKDLKNYATEPERQQIFLLESQRLALEKQIDAIDQEKDPALKLEKNKLLLQKRDQQEKLNAILEQERKIESEKKFIEEKEQTTTVASQKKALEQSRADLDQKIQEIEKKRWVQEKEIQDTDNKISQTDKALEQLAAEKNILKDKILGIDKSLRDIYSVVMAREEKKRKGQAQEEIARKEVLSGARAQQREDVQREQWTGVLAVPKKKDFRKTFQAEEDARKKFMQDVAAASEPRQGREQSVK